LIISGIETKKKELDIVFESKKHKIMDFLTTLGKIATILLADTPLPTYLGTWNKPRDE